MFGVIFLEHLLMRRIQMSAVYTLQTPPISHSDVRLRLRRRRNGSAMASRLRPTKTERLAASNFSIRQALNC